MYNDFSWIKTFELSVKLMTLTLKVTVKASSHIDDTTRHDSMRHDPFFSLPIQSNRSVHTYAARQCLVVTTKSGGTKNRSGSDFCRVSQRQYQENC